MTDANGCPIGIPTIPDLGNPKTAPCDLVKKNNIDAKNYLNMPKASARLAQIKSGINTSSQERSFSFGVNSNGGEEVTEIKIGTGGYSVDIVAIASTFTVKGGVHIHNPGGGLKPPSFGDVYAFLNANKVNNEFGYYYTITPDYDEYVFSITNIVKFKKFLTDHPEASYLYAEDSTWNLYTKFGQEAEYTFSYFKKQGKNKHEAHELALAFVLNKYDAGIAVSKKDNQGDFKGIFVEEQPNLTNPKKKIYLQILNCNLK